MINRKSTGRSLRYYTVSLRRSIVFFMAAKNLRHRSASKQKGSEFPGFPTRFRGAKHARGSRNPASATRQAGRQIGKHAGRRIRARGNAPRTRVKARRAFCAAGHCDWIVQGAPRRRSSAGAEARQDFSAREKAGAAGVEQGTFAARAQDVREAFARDIECAAPRRPLRSNAPGAGAPGSFRRAAPRQTIAARRRREGGPYQGTPRPSPGRAQSRAHSSETPQSRLNRWKRSRLLQRRLYTLQKKGLTLFVIPSEARNLSFFSWGRIEKRFLASLGMTKYTTFSAACLACGGPLADQDCAR
jgi:hypothetical protein